MARFPILLLLLLGSATAGCGSGGASVELDQLSEELAKAYCAKVFGCCTATEIQDQFGDFIQVSDEARCVEVYTAFVEAFLVGQIRGSVEKGRIEYHADTTGDCIATLRNAGCEVFANAQAELDGCEVMTGLVATADVCAWDEECGAGSYCDGDNFLTGQEGVCTAEPGDGDPCSGECAEGFRCISGHCQPLGANGAGCDSDNDCLSDHCEQPTPSSSGTCGTSTACDGI